MSGLQERITEAIWTALVAQRDDEDNPFGPCVSPSDDLIDGHVNMEAVAAAVIAALNLREEFTWSWDRDAGRGEYPRPGFGFTVDTREEAAAEADRYMTIVHRWVTGWEPS